MSRLSRSLNYVLVSSPSLIVRIKEYIDHVIFDIILEKLFYYELKNFINNLSWMLQAAWDFRSWDYTYNIDLFVKSLEITGNQIINCGWNKSKIKTGRQCIRAAKQLHKAYHAGNLDDRALNNTWKKILIEISTSRITINYKGNPESIEKLHNHINKRVEQQLKQRKKEAWDYINKNIESWWD